MTRKELLSKVEDAIFANPGQAVIATVDAVLTAVADDLAAESDKFARPVVAHQVGCTCSNCVAAEALNDAADRIRSMTGDPK